MKTIPSDIPVKSLTLVPERPSSLSVFSSDRSSQNPPGHQRRQHQERDHGGGWEQAAARRGDHGGAGAHRVLDERKQGDGEEEEERSLAEAQSLSNARQTLAAFVRQAEHPAVSQNATGTRVGRL